MAKGWTPLEDIIAFRISQGKHTKEEITAFGAALGIKPGRFKTRISYYTKLSAGNITNFKIPQQAQNVYNGRTFIPDGLADSIITMILVAGDTRTRYSRCKLENIRLKKRIEFNNTQTAGALAILRTLK